MSMLTQPLEVANAIRVAKAPISQQLLHFLSTQQYCFCLPETVRRDRHKNR